MKKFCTRVGRRVLAVILTAAMCLSMMGVTEMPHCGLQEHIHTEACCAQSSTDESAEVDATGTSICGLTEHVHSDECYAEVSDTSASDIDITEDTSSVQEDPAAESSGVSSEDTIFSEPESSSQPDADVVEDPVVEIEEDSAVSSDAADADIVSGPEPSTTNTVSLQIENGNTSFLTVAEDKKSFVFDARVDLSRAQFSEKLSLMLYITVDEAGAEPGELSVFVPSYFDGVTEHYGNPHWGVDVDALKTWLADYHNYSFLYIEDAENGIYIKNSEKVTTLHLSIPLALEFNTFDLAHGETYDYTVTTSCRGSELRDKIQATAYSGLRATCESRPASPGVYPSGNKDQRLLKYTNNLGTQYGISRDTFNEYRDKGYVFVEYKFVGYVDSSQRMSDVRMILEAQNGGVILGACALWGGGKYQIFNGLYMESSSIVENGVASAWMKQEGAGFSLRARADSRMENRARYEITECVIAAFPEENVHEGEMLDASVSATMRGSTVDGRSTETVGVGRYYELFDVEAANGAIYGLACAPYYIAAYYNDFEHIATRLRAGQDADLNYLVAVGMVRNQSRADFDIESPAAYNAELIFDQLYLGDFDLGGATRLTSGDYMIKGAGIGIYDVLSELNDAGVAVDTVTRPPDWLSGVDVTISVQLADNPGVWVEDMKISASQLWYYNPRALTTPIVSESGSVDSYTGSLSGSILVDDLLSRGVWGDCGKLYFEFNHDNVIAYKISYPHSVGYTLMMTVPNVTVFGDGPRVSNAVQTMLSKGQSSMPVASWFSLACQNQSGMQDCFVPRSSIRGSTSPWVRDYDDTYAPTVNYETSEDKYPHRRHHAYTAKVSGEYAGAEHTAYFYNAAGEVCDPSKGLASSVSFEASAPVLLSLYDIDFQVPDTSDLGETWSMVPDYNIAACRDVEFYALLPQGVSLASVSSVEQSNTNRYAGYWAGSSLNERDIARVSKANANTVYSPVEPEIRDIVTENNYKNSGRQFVRVKVHYDEMPFGWYGVANISGSRSESVRKGQVTHMTKAFVPAIRLNTVADFGYISESSLNFIMAAQYLKSDGTPYVLNEGAGVNNVSSPIYVDDGGYAGAYAECFADLNGDGITGESTVVSSESTVQLQKPGMISTARVMINGPKNSLYGTFAQGEPTKEYTYRLGYSVFGLESSNVVLFDSLEEYESTHYGALTGVDVSEAEKAGLHPVVFFNQKTISSEEYVARKPAVTLDDLRSGYDGWYKMPDTPTAQDLSKVRSVAVAFENDTFSDESVNNTYVYLKMRSPSRFKTDKQTATNRCFYTDQLSSEANSKSVMGNEVRIDYDVSYVPKLKKTINKYNTSVGSPGGLNWESIRSADGTSLSIDRRGTNEFPFTYFYELTVDPSYVFPEVLKWFDLEQLVLYDDVEMESKSSYAGRLNSIAWGNAKPNIFVETYESVDFMQATGFPSFMDDLVTNRDCVYFIGPRSESPDTTFFDLTQFSNIKRIYAYYWDFGSDPSVKAPLLYLNMTHELDEDGESIPVHNEFHIKYNTRYYSTPTEATSNQTTLTAAYINWTPVLPETGSSGVTMLWIPAAVLIATSVVCAGVRRRRRKVRLR